MYVKVIYNLRDCRNWTQPDLTHRQNIYSMAVGIFRVMTIKELLNHFYVLGIVKLNDGVE